MSSVCPSCTGPLKVRGGFAPESALSGWDRLKYSRPRLYCRECGAQLDAKITLVGWLSLFSIVLSVLAALILIRHSSFITVPNRGVLLFALGSVVFVAAILHVKLGFRYSVAKRSNNRFERSRGASSLGQGERR